MKPNLRIGVVYDFRNPPQSGIDNQGLYAEIMEQAVWLDGLGLDLIWFTEHHFVDDGYLPSWIPVASAMAARTKKVSFSSDISILPLYQPVRLAEDLAVLDNLSCGRVELGVGLGYVPQDFNGYGLSVKQRVSRTDESLEILTRCFRGERFSFTGKRYSAKNVIIKPDYVQPGGPPLWVAASSKNGALRAARFDAHLLPQGPYETTIQVWLDELKSSGRNPDDYRVGIIKPCFVTDDKERDWPAIRAAERFRMEYYAQAFKDAGRGAPPDQDKVRISQNWVVGNVDHCVAELSEFIKQNRITDLVTWAVPPGLRPDAVNGSLERFATEVAPRLKDAAS
ncbi:MAG: LLM class flavin-dependent oxidoreductase [Rhodospirillaceae bacterium]|jgi:alkanesulfonate monooxygenase SsuD/methylene tetrahydromethanopterin reductase-like flavin-dependent oxidoreductase (luciferase family)|nr:LLM class flavin-dependent oxidoreductase [Rhodospirillaceae bacterium]MBT7761103.1 LLM class flavin-dependent oxidoreductase [Rhodospirillaceae bacterium]